ncbi:MAG: CDP-diacylglycerol--serine O-phosphatidyltransferase [Planctomycetes bacterium]|nr:CDP-diacylglycerol--serine O-phosphatidyltransferase [Planctomycetota bacterium]MBI3844114.1 CDP-diacylglycerol--serine O-phosphatidyltransferase [Planctomycetota bacterium]
MTLKRISVLPTLLTLGNLSMGFVAIALVADSESFADLGRASRKLVTAAWLVFLAMLFDALDGKVARLTRGTSVFGAELDSLADVVSFGVAPALIAKVIVEAALSVEGPLLHPRLLLSVSGLYVACTALRLARYNVEHQSPEEGTGYFRGLPSPAAAGVVASTAILYLTFDPSDRPMWIARALPFLLPVLALLMVSRVPYAHLLNKVLRGRQPFAQVAEVVFMIVVGLLLKEYALALAFYGYLLLGPGVVAHRWLKNRRRLRHGVEW